MRILLIAALALAGCGKSRCAVFADLEACHPQRTPALARAITAAASIHGAIELDTLIGCAPRTTECEAYRACDERR